MNRQREADDECVREGKKSPVPARLKRFLNAEIPLLSCITAVDDLFLPLLAAQTGA